jgi:hypothetical protein
MSDWSQRLCKCRQDYLIFRVMILCGARPNDRGGASRFGPTKNRKSRYAPVPGSLRAELGCVAGNPPCWPGYGPFRGARRRSHLARRIRPRRHCARQKGRRDSGPHIPDVSDDIRHTLRWRPERRPRDPWASQRGFHAGEVQKAAAERVAEASEDLDARLPAKVVPIRRGA